MNVRKLPFLPPAIVSVALAALIGMNSQADEEFSYKQDFTEPGSVADFIFTDPTAWRINADGDNRSLELLGPSEYTPPFRSPSSIALIGTHQLREFVLEADLLQTGREYGHRDLCVFFGFQDPAHYYYAHIASKTDEHAHNIFIVDDALRTKISTRTTDGVDWGTDRWHHIKLERTIDPATIKVFFDDMTEPIMVAQDDRFAWGYVGFGSFDDTGRFDNITVTAPNARAIPAEFFQTKKVDAYQTASANGLLANEALRRCQHYVEGWMTHSDPVTGLIPRNLGQGRDVWNAADAAADNYPFMVLTTWFTDRNAFEGPMLQMLRTEESLTSRLGALPDDYSFSIQGFRYETVDLGRLIFGGSEYVKDGLLPLTEWLGESPWSKRMIAIIDCLWQHAAVETTFGAIPSTNVEINGELLQALSRTYWLTGDDKYLDWAMRLGDYYLLGDNHPTRDFHRLRLRDHGCEIVSGLVELYVACHFARPEKTRQYRVPIHEMLDRILEIGRNEHGMLCNAIAPAKGEVVDRALADTWGYTYNVFYTVYLIDGVERYRRAVRHVLSNLNGNYRDFRWEGDSADGYADSIEGAINLYNREPIDSVASWIDSETPVMFAKQRSDGVIEGWHGDGNFARTALMYALWKTQGLSIQPWRPDVRLGAVQRDDKLYVSIEADESWEGRIIFDRPRHSEQMHLPIDYPRINQFPQWWTVSFDKRYEIAVDGSSLTPMSADALRKGLPVKIGRGTSVRLHVSEVIAQE